MTDMGDIADAVDKTDTVNVAYMACHCHEMCSNKSTRRVTCVVEFALSVRIVSW